MDDVRQPMKLSVLWQNFTMALVSLEFVLAMVGYEPAYNLWINGWDGIIAFLGIGVGMKMIQRSTDRYIDRRYGTPDRGIEGD